MGRYRFVRRDSNHTEIVQALRACGRSVVDTHMVGRGFPDTVIGFQGVTYLLEIKPKKGSLQENQEEFHKNWRGSPILVARTMEEAIELTKGGR